MFYRLAFKGYLATDHFNSYQLYPKAGKDPSVSFHRLPITSITT
jgi:hypothetical protein